MAVKSKPPAVRVVVDSKIARLVPPTKFFYLFGGFLFYPRKLKGAKISARQSGEWSATGRLPVKTID
jgi:hypothetical protein